MPSVASGSDDVVIDGASADDEELTVSVRLRVTLPRMLRACTINVNVPDSVGVPLITPEELSLRPEGRDPLRSDQIIGVEPEAASV